MLFIVFSIIFRSATVAGRRVTDRVESSYQSCRVEIPRSVGRAGQKTV